jgi:hypothetical protein
MFAPNIQKTSKTLIFLHHPFPFFSCCYFGNDVEKKANMQIGIFVNVWCVLSDF